MSTPDLDEIAEEIDNPEPEAPEAPEESTPAEAPPAKPKQYKNPWDYRGHGLAKAINARVGNWLKSAKEDPTLPEECLLGEAATQTVEENAGATSIPGHYWLLLSVLAMAALIALSRLDAPPNGPGPVPKEPPPSMATENLPGEYAGAEIRPAA